MVSQPHRDVVGRYSIKGTVTLTVTGLFGSLTIGTVSVTAYDPGGEVVEERKFVINKTVPTFVSGSHSEDVELPVSYNDIVTRNISKVVIAVTGSDPGTLEVEIKTN